MLISVIFLLVLYLIFYAFIGYLSFLFWRAGISKKQKLFVLLFVLIVIIFTGIPWFNLLKMVGTTL